MSDVATTQADAQHARGYAGVDRRASRGDAQRSDAHTDRPVGQAVIRTTVAEYLAIWLERRDPFTKPQGLRKFGYRTWAAAESRSSSNLGTAM